MGNVTKHLKMTVPTGARVTATVASSSKKVCTLKGGKLVSLKAGSCKVTVKVTPKTGKATQKTATLKAT